MNFYRFSLPDCDLDLTSYLSGVAEQNRKRQRSGGSGDRVSRSLLAIYSETDYDEVLSESVLRTARSKGVELM